ncbi:MAG: cryptochrome/photolyase family protein [Pelagibacterales bacterium]|nr:cryptochrome/photolyase family protein [Pelagibacterales bacterium]
MKKNLHFIFGDQLSHKLLNLVHLDLQNDVILMCEVKEETSYVWHHPKKIAFIFSAMRHFADELRQKGAQVEYIKFDDENNLGSFDAELEKAIKKYNPQKILLTEPSEYRVWQKVLNWQKTLKVPFEIFPDERFLCSKIDFRNWAKGKKQLRLEFFYREMRKKHKILLDEKMAPVGGKWNYDEQNRKSPEKDMKSPKRISHKKDDITKEVLTLVEKHFKQNFGDLLPFHFAVNNSQAMLEAKHFIDNLLPNFGDYQDAMFAGEAYLYHSLLSSYINVGLIDPLELCQMAEKSYLDGKAPLNAVEGFIRQILGWREYVRGIYWLFAPQYFESNFFNAKNNLPEFYWGKKTQMFCIEEVVKQTKEHSYSHHIQRLMITGNFALLAAIDPKKVHEWYLAVYADAFEWVEMPNTIGMALHADGGIMASKPYAASGKYISRMSNFCDKCSFDPEVSVGKNACPFNSLYWNFISKNEDKLKKNQRMQFVYPTWHKMSEEKRSQILNQAQLYLDQINNNQL